MPTNGISFNTIPDSVTQRALAHNYSNEEKARREQMILNKDFYYGKQEQQLALVNEDVDPATVNLTRPIVKKRATMLYGEKLLREYTGPAQSIAFIEQVYKDNDIDEFMLCADLAAELTGSTLIHPTEDLELEGRVKLLMFDSSQVSVIQDEMDPEKLSALSLVKPVTRLSKRSTSQNPQVETVLHQQVWTETSVTTYDGFTNNGTLTNELQSTEPNELGFLPFTNILGERVHDQYLGHACATTTRKLNEVVNQTLTHLNFMIKMQGFTPIALSGYQSGEGVVIHPGRAFSLPAGAAAQVLSTQPKINETLEVLRYLEEKAFETGSVPKVAVVGGEGESGRELMVRFFPLLQVFDEKAVLYQKNELNLANLILRMAGLPLLEDVKVFYSRESVLPLSAAEDTLAEDITLNIKTPVDEVMRRNPELTELEAEAEVLANRDFNQSLQSASLEEEGEPEMDEDGNPIEEEDPEDPFQEEDPDKEDEEEEKEDE